MDSGHPWNHASTLYTGGTFDLFHAGHVNFLRQAADLAANVVVSLNTSEFVERFKGKPPVMSFEERRAVLLACHFVDAVVKNVGGEDSKLAIEVVSPDIIAVGSDWEDRDYHGQMGFDEDWLEQRKIRLVFIEYTSGISTTELKRRTVIGHQNG